MNDVSASRHRTSSYPYNEWTATGGWKKQLLYGLYLWSGFYETFIDQNGHHLLCTQHQRNWDMLTMPHNCRLIMLLKILYFGKHQFFTAKAFPTAFPLFWCNTFTIKSNLIIKSKINVGNLVITECRILKQWEYGWYFMQDHLWNVITFANFTTTFKKLLKVSGSCAWKSLRGHQWI